MMKKFLKNNSIKMEKMAKLSFFTQKIKKIKKLCTEMVIFMEIGFVGILLIVRKNEFDEL